MTQPTPTLLEDLELCAVLAQENFPDTAARLRAAAQRLKREIELAAPSSEQWNSHVTAVLKRINAGPLTPDPKEVT